VADRMTQGYQVGMTLSCLGSIGDDEGDEPIDRREVLLS